MSRRRPDSLDTRLDRLLMLKPRRPRVYVSGPITRGDVQDNLRLGIVFGLTLLHMGYAVFSPHALAAHAIQDNGSPPPVGSDEYEAWLAHDLAFVECCDALLRLPGESVGAEREVQHALAHGVRVCHSIKDLLAALPVST